MSEADNLQQKIQDTNDMIAKVERSLSTHPTAQSLLANLRSLQRRVEVLRLMLQAHTAAGREDTDRQARQQVEEEGQ